MIMNKNLYESNTSVKTVFFTFFAAPVWSAIRANLRLLGLPTLDTATYSWPWVKGSVLSHNPTYFRVWPENLVLV